MFTSSQVSQLFPVRLHLVCYFLYLLPCHLCQFVFQEEFEIKQQNLCSFGSLEMTLGSLSTLMSRSPSFLVPNLAFPVALLSHLEPCSAFLLFSPTLSPPKKTEPGRSKNYFVSTVCFCHSVSPLCSPMSVRRRKDRLCVLIVCAILSFFFKIPNILDLAQQILRIYLL